MRNLFRCLSVLATLAFVLPSSDVIEFEAGLPGLCTKSSSPKRCWSGGPDACTLNRVVCGGSIVLDNVACFDNMGNPACQGDPNCFQGSKHALRDTDCIENIIVPGVIIPIPGIV